jgi:hypothetical protein
MPGNLKGAELENFVRNAVESYWHETCTAKMGRDSMSVVDGNLKVYGIDNLSEIATKYQLADDAVLKIVEEFQTLGMVTL